MAIEISVPGSKSIANRALILKALTKAKTKLRNVPKCDDTKYMLAGLKELKKREPKIYTGNAGTTTRFLTALATLSGKKVKIDGDKRMRERPIKELAEALNALGAKVETKNGCPPVKIRPQKLKGGHIKLHGDISSQYLSALLMVAPFAQQKTTIDIVQKLYSKPYINMTIKIMKVFGLSVKNKNFKQFIIDPKPPNPPKNYIIESDASSASYIGAYAALHPKKKILLKNICKNSIQGDIAFLSCLKKMGCKISESTKGTLIQGPKQLKSLKTIDMNETPDLVMTFAILAIFSPGKTKIKNIGNLRIKETDRISALEKELKKLGIKVKTGKTYIEIYGKDKRTIINNVSGRSKISIETYNDHRIAMSFAILTDILPNITIKNPNCVSKSYTTFWQDLKKLQK